MEDLAGNANDLVEQDESTGSIPSPLFTGTKLNKRLRSKVWDDFIPTYVDGKVTRAECMHCHQVFSGTNGTSSLIRHLTNCIPATQKRPKMQEHTSFPFMQKVKIAAGSDLRQKKLSFLPSSQKKCTDTKVTAPEQELALPDIPTNTNRKNQDVDQNGSHEGPAAPEQKNHSLLGISTDNNRKNLSTKEIMLPKQMVIPVDTSQKHQEVDQDTSHEELIEMLAMHGHLPRMVEQDGFRKLVAWLNPKIKMPSHDDVMVYTSNLFQKEKSKLKEELIALCGRVCLSVYMWHYDPISPFLCLRVHYIDDEWEEQQKIIVFRAVDSSCAANELSDIILGAIEQWGLDGKIFCIILDDAFIDDSVASSVRANLQERNPLTAKRSLFVVRYATHLLDQVIQVGLDELGKIMEKLSKCSKHTKSLAPSAVQYPNCRYAPSSEDWRTARKICSILDDLHKHVDFALEYPTPAHFFNMAWDVKKDVNFKSYMCKDDDTFSKIQEKMQKKFKECWKVSFFHFCMPMVMDPECRLERIKSHIWLSDLDKNVRDCIHDVLDTFASLFNEYSDQVEDPSSTSGSKTSKGIVVDGDKLAEYYRYHQSQYSERPMAELDQYLQAPHLTTSEPAGLKRTAGKPSALRWWKGPCVLLWWKEHSLNYPTIARMARDVLALPCVSDWKVATRTATLAISESGSRQWVEELVCTQDWLTPAGTGEESTDDL
ncbi:zinc finger BED domain-containing protein RICESLEEPER 1-like [Setaria viridis]|uniref:zinc finger BED domain-containing protein RICESLEEPER 1-like n=1 Tax=Setaria viridis TaxID=4556 RepID=UPI0014936DA0|nr:zinc finger BED domain-containing protein RICESLEEPER 1-like [Setaria viridis]